MQLSLSDCTVKAWPFLLIVQYFLIWLQIIIQTFILTNYTFHQDFLPIQLPIIRVPILLGCVYTQCTDAT